MTRGTSLLSILRAADGRLLLAAACSTIATAMVNMLRQVVPDGDATDAELSHWLDVPEAALAQLNPDRLSRSQRCNLRRVAFIIAAACTALGDR